MADLTQVYAALQKADAAGDTEGAKQLADYIRSQPQQTAPDAAPQAAKSLDWTPDGNVPSQGRDYAQLRTGTFGENFSAGVGKSFVDTGHGLKQLATEAGGLLGMVPQNTVNAQRQQESQRAQADAPLMHTGGGLVGDLAGQAAQFAVPMGGIPRAASLLPRLGAAAATGAAMANTQPVTAEQTRAGNTGFGAAGGVAGELVGSAASALAAPSNAVTPEVAALVKKAQAMGIPLRGEQVSGSRPLAGISAAMDAVPFSGRDASRAAQRAAFNNAMVNTFGESGANVTTAVRKGQAALGAKYDAVLKNYPTAANQQLATELGAVYDAADKELSPSQLRVIRKQIQNVVAKVDPNGNINGEAVYNIKKMLDRISDNPDTSLAYHAGKLRDALMQGFDRSLPPTVAKDFAKTRQQYSNLIAVRELLKHGADGNITPAALANVKDLRGPLADVADVGAQFLKEPFGNSGTQNRMVGAGLLGGAGVGALFEPTVGLGALGTMGTARTANKLMQSKPFVNYLVQGSPKLQGLLSNTNALLPVLGSTSAVALQ